MHPVVEGAGQDHGLEAPPQGLGIQFRVPWADEQQTAAEADAVEQVRAAGKESEAIGTLGQSRPSVKTMFEEVYATEDWRITEQRREVGV